MHDAAARLDDIHREIERTGTTHVSLRERLDLFYRATGTTAADYDPDGCEDDGAGFCHVHAHWIGDEPEDEG